MDILNDKSIILCVSGSVASFKAVELASTLTKAGARVSVILTSAAEKFVTPLTFRSVTGGEVYTDSDLWGTRGHVLHVGLAQGTDLMVIAPATANTIAKLANGLADNLLTISALSTHASLLIAPAMDVGMYTAAATQANVATLKQRGARFAGPVEGRMASGLEGLGRFMEPNDIIDHIRAAIGMNGPLKGKRVIITAGGSREAIDPVRVITNRSSGKQGYALARAAAEAGADVTLISHPTALRPPASCHTIQVESAANMRDALFTALPDTDALIMAAAVADFTPEVPADQKIKKTDGGELVLRLKPTVDILAEVVRRRAEFPQLKTVVGFAAESQNLTRNAAEKLARKKLDLIAANDISAADAGFSVDTNHVTLFFADGSQRELPIQSKEDVAREIITETARLLGAA